MRRVSRFSLLLILLLGCTRLCAAQEGRPADAPTPPAAREHGGASWREFAPWEGRFAVSMPGSPVASTMSVESPFGPLSMRLYTLTAPAQYGVSYMDYPHSIEDSGQLREFFAGVRDGGLRTTGAKLIEEKEIMLGTHPGRSFKIQMSGGRVGRVRAYVVKNRLYQLIFTAGEGGAPDAGAPSLEDTANRFFDSFRLTAEGCPEGAAAAHGATATGEVVVQLKELSGARRGGKVPVVLGHLDESAAGTASSSSRIGEGRVLAGKALSKPPPAYPAIAKAARAQGTVTVQIIVDEEGKVSAAQAICGHPLLRSAAVASVRQWLFSPTLLDGKPVLVTGVVTVNFHLQ